jgi:hypothetical protein
MQIKNQLWNQIKRRISQYRVKEYKGSQKDKKNSQIGNWRLIDLNQKTMTVLLKSDQLKKFQMIKSN